MQTKEETFTVESIDEKGFVAKFGTTAYYFFWNEENYDFDIKNK